MYNMTDEADHSTEDQRKLMTIGRTAVDITEDDDNVYLADWVIPKGGTKADGEERRRIVWEMYEIWKTENPSQKRINKSIVKGVDTEICVEKLLISEVALHAYSNFRNVIALYYLDSILKVAKLVKNSDLISQKQKKYFKGGYMAELHATIQAKPYFEKAKLMVGVTRKKERIMYSVTAMDIK